MSSTLTAPGNDPVRSGTECLGVSIPKQRRRTRPGEPGTRSETVNVDWFRFWLKEEEDPEPAKAEQYKRWRELKKMQEQNGAKVKATAEN